MSRFFVAGEPDRAAYIAQIAPMLPHLDVGHGSDVTIAEVAGIIARMAGVEGRSVRDTDKTIGAPRKPLGSSRLQALGWEPRIWLEDGLQSALGDFTSANVVAGRWF